MQSMGPLIPCPHIVTACSLTYEKGKRVHSLPVLKEIANTLICHTLGLVNGDSPLLECRC